VTDQRLTLAVPSPATSMSLGKAWGGTDWNSDGFCVNTDARVWLDADGTDKSDSTLAMLSNGGSGQLLLQSLQKNLWIYSKERTVVGTNASAFFGGGKGVKIMGGLSMSFLANITWDFVDAEKADEVGPDADDPSSDTAAAFADSLEGVGDFWAITDVSSNVLAISLEILRSLFGVKGSGTSASSAAAVAGIRATTNSIGNLVGTSRLYSDGVPGLHIYSWGSLCIASPTFTSMFALAGMTEFGIAVSDYGFTDAHAMGGVSATFKSLCYSAIEGSEISVAAGLDVEGCARTGEWKTYGTNLYFGAKGGEAGRQLPTLSTAFEATRKITLEEPVMIEFDSGGNVELTSGTIKQDAKLQLMIKNPSYTVTLTPTGLKIDLAKLATVDLGATAAVLKVGSSMTLETSAGEVLVGLPSCSVGCDKTGAWSWTAPMVVFL